MRPGFRFLAKRLFWRLLQAAPKQTTSGLCGSRAFSRAFQVLTRKPLRQNLSSGNSRGAFSDRLRSGRGLTKCRFWRGDGDQAAVLHRVQRNGLGRLLMNEVLAVARQNGIAELILKVQKVNQSAVSFYSCSGFRVDGEETFRVGTRHYTALVMRLSFCTPARDTFRQNAWQTELELWPYLKMDD